MRASLAMLFVLILMGTNAASGHSLLAHGVLSTVGKATCTKLKLQDSLAAVTSQQCVPGENHSGVFVISDMDTALDESTLKLQFYPNRVVVHGLDYDTCEDSALGIDFTLLLVPATHDLLRSVGIPCSLVNGNEYFVLRAWRGKPEYEIAAIAASLDLPEEMAYYVVEDEENQQLVQRVNSRRLFQVATLSSDPSTSPMGVIKPIDPICFLPKNVSACRAAITMFYYNQQSLQCEEFTWGGCAGNANRFETKEECEAKCNPAPQQQMVQSSPTPTFIVPTVPPSPGMGSGAPVRSPSPASPSPSSPRPSNAAGSTFLTAPGHLATLCLVTLGLVLVA